MSQHHLFVESLPTAAAASISIGGEEAHHAIRVRRLVKGDSVSIADGRGHIADATITRTHKLPHTGEWQLDAAITQLHQHPLPTPALHVYASAPKGDHLAAMIDGLSQVGAASWRPLLTHHTIVDPREAKLDRMRRIAIESLKQCGRPHLLDIGPPTSLADALRARTIVVADASGPPWRPTDAQEITLLIGPEGGWSPDELTQAAAAGATIATFGRHIMRTETAAIVTAAMILATALPPGPAST